MLLQSKKPRQGLGTGVEKARQKSEQFQANVRPLLYPNSIRIAKIILSRVFLYSLTIKNPRQALGTDVKKARRNLNSTR